MPSSIFTLCSLTHALVTLRKVDEARSMPTLTASSKDVELDAVISVTRPTDITEPFAGGSGTIAGWYQLNQSAQRDAC